MIFVLPSLCRAAIRIVGITALVVFNLRRLRRILVLVPVVIDIATVALNTETPCFMIFLVSFMYFLRLAVFSVLFVCFVTPWTQWLHTCVLYHLTT